MLVSVSVLSSPFVCADSVNVCSPCNVYFFQFGIEGRIWVLIKPVLGHSFLFHFSIIMCLLGLIEQSLLRFSLFVIKHFDFHYHMMCFLLQAIILLPDYGVSR